LTVVTAHLGEYKIASPNPSEGGEKEKKFN